MSYRNNLQEQESVVWEFAPHWIIFLRPMLWFAVTLSILLLGPFYTITRFQPYQGPSLYQYLATLTFVLAFYHTLKTFIYFSFSRFVITTKRIFILKGFVRQSISEINLANIKILEILQSLLGKGLNYGTLRLGSKANQLSFQYLAYPQWVRGLLQLQLEKKRELHKDNINKKPDFSCSTVRQAQPNYVE